MHSVIETYLQAHPVADGELLYRLDAYLGSPAPLLAYTKVTGETWLRTLEAGEAARAAPLLSAFRSYLRDEGWLDAARPVNQFD